MANEITASASLAASKNGGSVNLATNLVASMAGNICAQNTQLATTSSALITNLPATAAYLYLRNLDATNYIEIALDSGNTQKIAKLLPGQFMIYPPSTTTVYCKANTASCLLQSGAAEL